MWLVTAHNPEIHERDNTRGGYTSGWNRLLLRSTVLVAKVVEPVTVVLAIVNGG